MTLHGRKGNRQYPTHLRRSSVATIICPDRRRPIQRNGRRDDLPPRRNAAQLLKEVYNRTPFVYGIPVNNEAIKDPPERRAIERWLKQQI